MAVRKPVAVMYGVALELSVTATHAPDCMLFTSTSDFLMPVAQLLDSQGRLR